MHPQRETASERKKANNKFYILPKSKYIGNQNPLDKQPGVKNTALLKIRFIILHLLSCLYFSYMFMQDFDNRSCNNTSERQISYHVSKRTQILLLY